MLQEAVGGRPGKNSGDVPLEITIQKPFLSSSAAFAWSCSGVDTSTTLRGLLQETVCSNAVVVLQVLGLTASPGGDADEVSYYALCGFALAYLSMQCCAQFCPALLYTDISQPFCM